MKLRIPKAKKKRTVSPTRAAVMARLKRGYLKMQEAKAPPPEVGIEVPAVPVPGVPAAPPPPPPPPAPPEIEGVPIEVGVKPRGRAVMFEEREPLTGINIYYPLIPRAPKKGEAVFSYANLKWNPATQAVIYNLVEPKLTPENQELVNKAKTVLEEQLDIDISKLGAVQAKETLREEIGKALARLAPKISEESKRAITYYIERDTLGYGRIHALMVDPDIEDISCDGVGLPLYVYHRDPRFASIKTNVVFETPEELNAFVVRLAQKCNKTISIAEPLLDGALPDGSRVQATLGTDIARKGSNFTIRKFTEKPLTPTHMLRYHTLDSTQLAYLWMAVENGMTILVSGGTATGKTALLNALSLFIRPNLKVVSIEDSVAGDSNIVVFENGRFQKTTIKNLVDNQIKKHGSENLSGREVCSTNLHLTSVYCMDKKGKIHLAPISSFIRHKTSKRIYEVKTATGRKIKVTGDHSLFSLNREGELVPAKTSLLGPGDFIAVPRLLPAISSVQTINLLACFNKLDGLFIKGELIKTLKPELQSVPRPYETKKWWLKHGVMPVDVFVQLMQKCQFNEHELEQLRIWPRNGGHALPVKIPIDSTFLTFLGLWIAEGCYDKNSVIVSNTDTECKEVVRQVGASLGIPVKTHSDGISLMLNSCVLKRVMQNMLDLKGNAYTKNMPSWMFNLDNTQLGHVLKGYFSGDGHVTKFEIQARTSSVQLLKDLQTALLRFGVVARQAKFYPKDKTYGLRISSSDMLAKFKTNAGFLQRRKQERLETACSRPATHTVSDIIPLSKTFLKQLEKEVGGLGTNSYWYGSRPGRSHLKNILKLSGRATKKTSDLVNSDIFWDRIVHIKPVENTDGYVYDLSIPRFENFVTENIIAHNTAELRLALPHWIPHVARTPLAIKGRVGEVTLFDLLRSSLRQRPDYLVLGEVRGKEAFVLFQQIASIPGKEKVLVLNGNNLKRTPISQITNDKQYLVPTADPDTGKVGIQPLQMQVEHPSVAELYRITTESGREVVTKGSHSVFTYSDGIQPLTVSRLKRGDDILIPAKLPSGYNNVEYLDLIELLPNIRVYAPKLIKKASRKLGFEAASKIAGLTTISNYYGVNNCALPSSSFKKLMEAADIPYSADDLDVRFERGGSPKTGARLELSPELLRFLGYHISEGSTNKAKRNCSITLYNNNPEVLVDMRHCIKTVCGKAPKERETHGHGTATELRFNHRTLFELLRTHCGTKSDNLRIPDFIFGLSKKRIGQFLSGLYSGDSTMRPDRFVYYTTSRELANDLALLLLAFGIVCRIKKRKRAGRKTTDYELTFYRESDKKEFLKYVRPAGKRVGAIRKGRPSNPRLKGDIFIDKVLDIEKTRLTKPVPVYDLSVPGTQNFIGGFGGILLHNTGHPALATIHAASIPQLIDRLITPPISLPPSLLENVDIVIFLTLSRLKGAYVRRADSILEIVGLKEARPVTNKVFEWKPITDKFEAVNKSVILKKIAHKSGLTEDSVKDELLRRKMVLDWMFERGVLDYREVAKAIAAYYSNPERVMDLVAS